MKKPYANLCVFASLFPGFVKAIDFIGSAPIQKYIGQENPSPLSINSVPVILAESLSSIWPLRTGKAGNA